MVANALVYHPALAHWLRFVATTGTYLYPCPFHPILGDTWTCSTTSIPSHCIKGSIVHFSKNEERERLGEREKCAGPWHSLAHGGEPLSTINTRPYPFVHIKRLLHILKVKK